MALDWVTLVKCRNLVEADLVRCQLEGAGVAAFQRTTTRAASAVQPMP